MSVFEHEHEYSKTVVFKWRYIYPQGYTNLQSCLGSLKGINAYIRTSYIHSLNLISPESAVSSEPSFPTTLSKQPSCLANSNQGSFLSLGTHLELAKTAQGQQQIKKQHWIESRVYPHLVTLATP